MDNCWELMQCGRQAGGDNVAEFGECVASKNGMGHSCWAIAGTLCGGLVQGSVKDKHSNCLICRVYGAYNRMTGSEGPAVALRFPEEEQSYQRQLRQR